MMRCGVIRGESLWDGVSTLVASNALCVSASINLDTLPCASLLRSWCFMLWSWCYGLDACLCTVGYGKPKSSSSPLEYTDTHESSSSPLGLLLLLVSWKSVHYQVCNQVDLSLSLSHSLSLSLSLSLYQVLKAPFTKSVHTLNVHKIKRLESSKLKQRAKATRKQRAKVTRRQHAKAVQRKIPRPLMWVRSRYESALTLSFGNLEIRHSLCLEHSDRVWECLLWRRPRAP